MLNTFLLKIAERRKEIQRYFDEIEDYRPWQSEEATFRIRGIIFRLNKLGVTKINLSQCFLNKANLNGADLRKANFAGAKLIDANLGSANLQETLFVNADLNGAILCGANLMGATLYNSYLDNANLGGIIEEDLAGYPVTDESHAFIKTKCPSANLSKSDLRRAKFKGAIMRGSNFTGANFQNADIREVDLTGAVFVRADLRNVNWGWPPTIEELANDSTIIYTNNSVIKGLETADFTDAKINKEDMKHLSQINSTVIFSE